MKVVKYSFDRVFEDNDNITCISIFTRSLVVHHGIVFSEELMFLTSFIELILNHNFGNDEIIYKL